MSDVKPETVEEVPPQAPEVDMNSEPVKVDTEAETAKLEAQAQLYIASQTKPVIVPSFAAWFCMDDVHHIEKTQFPDFFSTSSKYKSAKIYQDVRNFMVNTYRLNPLEYLTVTAARRNIACDVASIVRIHAFLEKWGIINYQIDPRSKPSLIGPSYTGHFQVTLDAPEGLKPFVPTVVESNANVDENDDSKKISVNMLLRKNIYDSTSDFTSLTTSQERQKLLQSKSYTCHTCAQGITTVRYHNLRSKQGICNRCFSEGQFGGNFHSADFVRLDMSHVGHWSDSEILLLLEGVEMFDDWSLVAKHVGTRSREDCLSQYLSLPIEDQYLPTPVASTPEASSPVSPLTDAIKQVLASDKLPQVQANAKELAKQALPEAEAAQLVELTVERLDLKFKKLALIEQQMDQARRELAEEKQKLVQERLHLQQQVAQANEQLKQHGLELKNLKHVTQLSEEKEEEKQPELKKIVETEVEPIGAQEPSVYVGWSL